MSKSLRELLEQQVKALEFLDDIDAEEFTPEKLSELQLDIKDKVDAIRHKMLTWESTADLYDTEYVKPWVRARDALYKKSENLKKYLHQQMAEKGYEKLPGNFWRVQFQKSSPSIRYNTDPTPTLYLNKEYRDYMVQDVTYRWNTDEVKTSLQNGKSLPFAELTHSRHIRFFTNKSTQEITE